MNHGGYDVIRRALTRDRSVRGHDKIVEGFLAAFDEQENGRYVNDIDEWSVKGLYDACKSADADSVSINEAGELATGTFTQALTGLIAKQVLRSYDEIINDASYIADQLVDVRSTNKKEEKVLRFSSLPELRYTRELEPMQPFNMGESYYGYRTYKFSREISISEELVIFDQTDQIWEKAQRLGRAGAETRERLILESIMDRQSSRIGSDDGIISSDQYVYYPSNAGADLYSASSPTGITTSGNLVTSNALADYTDIRNCRQRMNGFLDDTDERLKDSNANKGKRIRRRGLPMVLIPEALVDQVFIIQNTMNKLASANNDRNPANGGPSAFQVRSSIILDDDSETTWYYGYPKDVFRLYQVRPLRLMSHDRRLSLDMMRRGVYSWAAADWYAGMAAMDNTGIIKCTA